MSAFKVREVISVTNPSFERRPPSLPATETVSLARGDSPVSASARKRIFLVDDHDVLREGLTGLINNTTDLLACGGASTAEQALQDIPKTKADLVVTDLSLPGTSGLELVKSLKSRYPSLFILVLSMHDEALFAERCLRAGAHGYIMKHQAIRELLRAIHRILAGGIYLSDKMSDRMLSVLAGTRKGSSTSPLELLSDREMEVFEMSGRGLGTSEIAQNLHLSVKTIETYKGKIKEKLVLKSASDLRMLAMKWIEANGILGNPGETSI